MTKYQGGYIGNTPGWANQNRSGVWNVAEQVSLKAKNQWPFEDGTIALRYILRNFNTADGISYDSGSISVPKDPDLIFWGITGAGFSAAQASVGGSGYLGNGGPGETVKGAVYLSWRRPLIVQVATVNGSGGITSIAISQLGKGLRSLNNGATKSLTTTSAGTGATFALTRDASNLTTATLVSSGSGYSVGDLLEWNETLGDGSGNTMDPFWDLILHGVAGGSGSGGGAGVYHSNYGIGAIFAGTPAGGAAPSNSIAASAGGNGQTGHECGGGGGGAGWGGGAGGSGGDRGAAQAGKPGYSPLNTTYVTNGAPSSINYGSRAIELLVNGVQVKLIANAIDSYSLANV